MDREIMNGPWDEKRSDCAEKDCKKFHLPGKALCEEHQAHVHKMYPTIKELEMILSTEEEKPVTILPNGEIAMAKHSELKGRKPLTFRENLGGEYAHV